MAFLRRLSWYLAGLSIGILCLAFFLKQKSGQNGINFCYLPNCRVLKDMRSKPLAFTPQIPPTSRDTLRIQTLLTQGTIDFSKSDTHAQPCKTYHIAHTLNNTTWTLHALNCKDTLKVRALIAQ